ncbi:1-acyl-sn-glycerol-3-phosphate acyltransferase [Micrococcus luteus]
MAFSAPAPGSAPSAWHRGLVRALGTVAFGRPRILGEVRPGRALRRGSRSTRHTDDGHRPRLYLASHRNGAIDGCALAFAAPGAQFLVSAQLLRHPLLRLLFTGIPVVRPKDVERYGMDPAEAADPVTAGVRHLAAGGDLVVLPEGTSEWSHAPQPYRKGAARIVAACRAQGVDVEVVPVGLFYSAPDRYRSRVEVLLGDPVLLPDDGPSPPDAGSPGAASPAAGAPEPAEVDRLHGVLSAALDGVSVDCPDEASFQAVLSAAGADARDGEGFIESFLAHQRQARVGPVPLPGVPAPRWPRMLGLALQAPIAPVLVTAWAVGKKADAVNTVSFFRVLGGTGAALLWAPVLAGLTVAKPAAGAAALVSTAAGWALLGTNRWRL